MERDTRQHLRAITEQVASWSNQARAVRAHREQIESAGSRALGALRGAAIDVPRDGTIGWRVLPLQGNDAEALAAVARQTQLPLISPTTDEALSQLTTQVADHEPPEHVRTDPEERAKRCDDRSAADRRWRATNVR